MNWDAIGAIAETLGAVGVIASLVYLARQMGQNTRAVRSSACQQVDESLHTTMMTALQIPGLDQVVRAGTADFQELNEEDAFRFSYWAMGVMKRFDTAYYQYRVGMLDEDRWQVPRHDLKAFLSGPGLVQWLRGTPPGMLSPEFVTLVAEILAEEPDRDS
jgi:hypothetical protein